MLLLQDVYLYASYIYLFADSYLLHWALFLCFNISLVCVCCDFTAVNRITVYAENVQIMALHIHYIFSQKASDNKQA